MRKSYHVPAQPLTWIKSSSGEIFICPIEKIRDLKNPTDSELRLHCVPESENPQNN
jgi:hypothetical protein